MAWRRLSTLVIPMMVGAVGCGDDGLPTGSGSGSGSSGGAETGSSTATPVTMTETSSPGTTVEPSSSGTTTLDPDAGTSAGETCIDGTWTGIFSYGFETVAFTPCEGEPQGDWWFENGPGVACEASLVTVTGTVCGPGSYGHLGFYFYTFTGTVSGDPCLPAECGVEPETCAPFEPLCAAECSLVDQDCPEGEKCVPSSPTRMAPWTELVCTQANPEPLGPGEPCTIFAPYDDCAVGYWCIPDAPGSNAGVCVELCTPETTCTEGECSPCDASELVPFGVCVPPTCLGEPGCPGVC